MSGLDGLTTEPEGAGRWAVLETGRPASEARIGTVTGNEHSGYALTSDGDEGPPAGTYGTLDDAVAAVAMWRLARFEGHRP
ncbi:hypothetical protein [Amnibacterium sp.]|uniref:hypothetical protein n=1 Tax=Amnibacterium sp. TaxID=1872496 RepID=UPI00262DB45B|nr:hypothetical protein [Amnibacterium sp.]MCU1474119.1 hypothetical protein [Amnibacterium sp.]